MFPELPMGPVTKKQWKKYKQSTKCHICYKPFTLRDLKVRDHCPYTGLYRGPAHSLCNLLANVYEAFRDTCLKHYKLFKNL